MVRSVNMAAGTIGDAAVLDRCGRLGMGLEERNAVVAAAAWLSERLASGWWERFGGRLSGSVPISGSRGMRPSRGTPMSTHIAAAPPVEGGKMLDCVCTITDVHRIKKKDGIKSW